MKANTALISLQDWNSLGSDCPEMLKPPWWAASLLLQHMVDELLESRTLSESVKVGIRPENRSVTVTTCHSGPDSHLGASRQVSFAKGECTQIQPLAHLDANRCPPIITEDQLERLAIQWLGRGRNIERRTLNMERRSEEKRRLAMPRWSGRRRSNS